MYYYLLISIIIILILFILLLLMDKGRDKDDCDITNATCWLYLKNKLDEKLDEKDMHPKGSG